MCEEQSWMIFFLYVCVCFQEILEEVFRELHKVRDEILDGMLNLLYSLLLTHSYWLLQKRNSGVEFWFSTAATKLH